MRNNDDKTQLIRLLNIILRKVLFYKRVKDNSFTCPYCGRIMELIKKDKDGKCYSESYICYDCQARFLRYDNPPLIFKKPVEILGREIECPFCCTKYQYVKIEDKTQEYECSFCKTKFVKSNNGKPRESEMPEVQRSLYLCPLCNERMYKWMEGETHEFYKCPKCEGTTDRKFRFPLKGNEPYLFPVTIKGVKLVVPPSLYKVLRER